MPFAQPQRTEHLGEFSVGAKHKRRASLAVVRVLIVYDLLTENAGGAIGGNRARASIRSSGF